MAYGAITVPATANGIEIVAKNLSRVALLLYNNGANTIFLGEDNSVDITNGYPLKSGDELILAYDADESGYGLFYKGAVFGIVAAATENLRYWEIIPGVEYD